MPPRTSGPAGPQGFTLIELMIVVVVVGILATIAVGNFSSVKARAIDASMKSDLRTMMTALEDYEIQFGELPADLATFQAAMNPRLSPGVVWDKFEREVKNGVLSVHMHLSHPQSPNKWHADYPAEGTRIEIR